MLCLYHSLGIFTGITGFGCWLYNDFLGFMSSQAFFVRLSFPMLLVVDSALVVSLLGFVAYMFAYNVQFICNNITTIDWLKDRGVMTTSGENTGQHIRSKIA